MTPWNFGSSVSFCFLWPIFSPNKKVWQQSAWYLIRFPGNSYIFICNSWKTNFKTLWRMRNSLNKEWRWEWRLIVSCLSLKFFLLYEYLARHVLFMKSNFSLWDLQKSLIRSNSPFLCFVFFSSSGSVVGTYT